MKKGFAFAVTVDAITGDYTGRASRKYLKVWNMYSILVEAKCMSFLQGVQSDKRHTTTVCVHIILSRIEHSSPFPSNKAPQIEKSG